MRSSLSAPISMRMPLLLVIVAFAVLKIPHLSYPFYWDESWPYASAINDMYEHGPGLAPWALPPELSRGHPLFFHFVISCWMRVFGSSHIAMHAGALFISIALLISIYEIAGRLLGHLVAFFATALLASQEMFYVQSSFLLPEVLVALLSLAVLYSYSARKYALCTLLTCTLVLTKESGLVAIALIAADAAASAFNPNVPTSEKFARARCAIVPIALYGAFLLLQKHCNGWYFYPLHTGFIERNVEGFWYRLQFACLTDLFPRQNRHLYFLIAGTLSILLGIKQRSAVYFALPLFVLFTFGTIGNKLPGQLPGAFWLPVFVSSWALTTYFSIYRSSFLPRRAKRFLTLISCFILLYTLFSSANFYTGRYMIAPLTQLCILVPALLYPALPSLRGISFVITLSIFSISLSHYRHLHGHGDTELGAFNAMTVEQAVTSYLEAHNYHNAAVSTGAFLQSVHLTNVGTGFLQKGQAFTHLKWEIDDTTRIIIFDSVEPDDRIASVKKDTAFHLLFRVESGKEWGEIYERKRNRASF